jgi:uncharacterized protein
MQRHSVRSLHNSAWIIGVMTGLFLCRISASAQNVEGQWLGTLNVMGQKLRIVFHIEKTSDTSYSATLDSPDQGAKGIPVPETRWNDKRLVLAIPAIAGKYEGAMQNDTSITGSWTQGGMSFPLDIVRTTGVVELRRPQKPQKPFPYDEEEVVFENTSAGITLAGTLTKPRTTSPLPCAVMITGSGPQNRNESIFGHDPFLVIADYLSRRGMAVLRYDDRGVGQSKGNFATATTDDFASDARSAVAYLRSRKDIDAARIGLIGHSEGGLIAPMVAADSKDVAFIVLLAGTGLVGEEILYLQESLIMKANGASREDIDREHGLQARIFSVLKSETDTAVIMKKVLAVYHDHLASLPDSVRKQNEQSEAMMEKQVAAVVSPWFMRFLVLDPKPALRKVRCPVLAMNGELDLQVPCKENLDAISAALKEGGNANVTIKKLPGLNHLFQTATTGSPTEYPTIEETVAPAALETIDTWMQEKVIRR